MFKRSFLAILVLLISAAPSYCITADEIVGKLQEIYDGAEDYSTDFFQESRMSTINRVQKASGRAYFKKHGRMYWEYEKPAEQKFVSNGKKVWLYQPEMNQVQVFDYANLNLSNTENSFLDGMGNLKNDFIVKYDGEEGSDYLLELTPKDPKLGFKAMKMHIDKKTFNVVKTVTRDAYGNDNTITFKNASFNGGIKDDFFDFKVPDGVHIVSQPGRD